MRVLISSGFILRRSLVYRSAPEDCAHEVVGRPKYNRVPGWEGMGDCRRCGSTVMDPDFRAKGAPVIVYRAEVTCAAF